VPDAQATEPTHLRSYAFRAFVLVAVLPVLILAAVDSQLIGSKQEADGGARLREAVTALSEHVDNYVADHVHGDQSLAAALTNTTGAAESAVPLLAEYNRIYPGFITLFIADGAGVVRHVYPPQDAAAPLPPIADRPYFMDAIRSRQLAISDVILGRLSHVPIVTIAMPVLDANGSPAGVAGGSLDLSRFATFAGDLRALEDAGITIVDQQNRVIFASSETGYTPLQALAADPLIAAAGTARSGVFRYRQPIAESRGAARLAATAQIATPGWRVFVEQPLIHLRLQTVGYYTIALTLVLLALGGAVLGAHHFSTGVTRPLEELVAIVRRISAHGVAARARLSTDPPAEIAALLDDVNSMQSRLADSYHRLQQALGQRVGLRERSGIWRRGQCSLQRAEGLRHRLDQVEQRRGRPVDVLDDDGRGRLPGERGEVPRPRRHERAANVDGVEHPDFGGRLHADRVCDRVRHPLVAERAQRRGELLAHDRRRVALPDAGLRLDDVAAAAPPGAGVRARRRHPVGRGLPHLDGVSTPEPVAVAALGDLDDHPLPRQRVADEHHPTLGARHGVPAVGDRTDLDLEPLPDPRAAAGLPGPRLAGRATRPGRHRPTCWPRPEEYPSR